MPKKVAPTLKKDVSFHHHEALAEIELYKLLVDSVQDYAIFMLDTQGNVRTWNKGAQKNLGYLAEEIIGKHFSTFYLQKDKKANKPAKELELARQFGRVEDEDWRVRKDGSQYWANVIITALFDSFGTLVGYAKITRDLTERKNQEDELSQANMRLKAQQKELESINRSKDEFISLASHQLRTPATGIKQYLGMLLDGFTAHDPELTREFIEHAFESNERQINIVENLLKVAQIDAGKVMLQQVPTNLCNLAVNIIRDYGEILDKRQQNITCNLPERPVMANIDPTYMRMALENILDNASKYTQNGGDIQVTIRSTKDNAIIKIKDNGVGIASKDIDKLFKKFSRIPNERSDAVGGTGLGLYWLERVIDLHGGSVSVDSTVKEGSSFQVTVPTGGLDA